MVWVGALLLVLALVGASRAAALRQVEREEQARLSRVGRALLQALDQQLQGSVRLLSALAQDLPADSGAAQRRLDVFANAATGVLAVRLVAPDGTVSAQRRVESGATVAQRLTLRQSTATGSSLELELAGSALALPLAAVLYAPDMQARLDAHGAAPQPVAQVGPDAASSAAEPSLQWQERLAVQALAQPLQLSLARSRHAVRQTWRERTWVAVAVWTALFTLSAVLLSVFHRNRRSDLQRYEAHAGRLALALQGGDLGLWDLDLADARLVVDARSNQMLGLAPVQTRIDWDDWRAQILPADWPEVIGAHEACLRGEVAQRVLRCRMRHADGRWLWVVDRGKVLERRADGTPLRMVGTRADISDVMQMRDALRRSEERLSQVVRAAGIGVFEHDHVTNLVESAPEHLAIWGFGAGEQPGGEDFLQRLHPHDREGVLERFALALGPKGDGRFDSEHRIVVPDGSVRWIRVRTQTVFEGEGPLRKPVRTVGGVTDITEGKHAQTRLEQQAALLDQAQDAIVVRTLEGRIAYWNGGAERIYGWTADEAVGRMAGELLYQDPVISERIRLRLLAVGEHTEVVRERRRDGRAVQMEGHYTVLRDERGQPQAFFAIKTDVTRRLELETQLLKAQRLEAVGQLTGGVAHDFNNLLTVILGNADLLIEQLGDRPPLLRLADMMRTAAQRGADLTHGLLAFARRQPLQPKSVDVYDTLIDMHGLLRRTLREDIELELVRGAGLWPALVDPAQLESAVLNLVLNARDAMPEGGKITLETANAHIDDEYARRHDDVSAGQYVQVCLSDTGHGMTPEQLARAFEPFFTTKSMGKGTGLGLAMVYGFVKQSRGHIKLYSEPQHGTTVRMYLPRSHEGPAAATAQSEPHEQDFRGSATILVVEDDPLVRSFAEDVLKRLGYTVLASADGAAALEILRGHDDIALLFTDVVMPGGMNGRELAQAAAQLRPGLPILFTSGYTQNAIVHHGRLDRGVQLLDKPYRGVDLARRVWTVLQGGSNYG